MHNICEILQSNPSLCVLMRASGGMLGISSLLRSPISRVCATAAYAFAVACFYGESDAQEAVDEQAVQQLLRLARYPDRDVRRYAVEASTFL